MIKEIGTVSRYFPKHYMAPPKWMRRFFQIRHRVIPRYLYFRFLLSLFYLILGPLNTVIFIAAGCDNDHRIQVSLLTVTAIPEPHPHCR